MLRGYIEQVTPELISGWLYAEHAPVNGRIVLAMLDGGRAARTDHTDPVKTDPKQTDPSLTDHDQSHNARRSAAGASAKGAAE